MERRNSDRIPVDIPIRLESCAVKGKIVNLTEDGCGLSLEEPLASLDCSELIFEHGSGNSLHAQIKILWEEKKNESAFFCGGTLIGSDETAQKVLEKILDRAENAYYRVPQDRESESLQDAVVKRREWITERTRTKCEHLAHTSLDPESIRANIENFIGVTQVPLGIAGPLRVNGEHAKGIFYVPFATTEGTLVATYQHGMLALTKSGGANVVVTKSVLDISPMFILEDISQAKEFIHWQENHFDQIKDAAESTTHHGKLLKIRAYSLGRRVLLNFQYHTADAMGLNMINIATHRACEYIMGQTKAERFYLRANLSSDKKVSFFNLINSYGKEVLAEATISKEIMRKYLHCTVEQMYDFCWSGTMGSIQAGMVGMNAHFANGLAAIFIACGQDVAQIVNASIGMSMPEITKDGDFYVSIKLPNLVIGTIGGGTRIGTQRECLELMDCYGDGKAEKFAEIVAAALLGGELTLSAALASGNFIHAHAEKRKMAPILEKEERN